MAGTLTQLDIQAAFSVQDRAMTLSELISGENPAPSLRDDEGGRSDSCGPLCHTSHHSKITLS